MISSLVSLVCRHLRAAMAAAYQVKVYNKAVIKAMTLICTVLNPTQLSSVRASVFPTAAQPKKHPITALAAC